MDGPIYSPQSLLRALHLVCVSLTLGGAATGMVVRALAVRESGSGQLVVARLLQDIGSQVELAGLLGTVATGSLLLASLGVPDQGVWFAAKMALVVTGATTGILDGKRTKRAADCGGDAGAVSGLLRPGLHQVSFACYLVAIILAAGQAM